MVDTASLRSALPHCLEHTDFRALGTKYEGKVRDNYSTHDGRRFIVVSDRISAFDRVLGTVPFKGQVLNGLAAWWFEKTKDVADNHVLRVPDPNVLECIDCTPPSSSRWWCALTRQAPPRPAFGRITSAANACSADTGSRTDSRNTRSCRHPSSRRRPSAPKGEHDVSGSYAKRSLRPGRVTSEGL